MPAGFPELLAIISVVLSLTGTGIYIRSILRGEVKPHLYTWIVWSILPAIGFFAQIHGDAGAGAWATGTMSLASFFVALLAFKYGERHRTKGDLAALIISITAILPWVLTKDPLGSVILISLIDVIAFYPTYRKSWRKPYEENLQAYGISTTVMGLSLFAMDALSVTTLLYPAVFVSANMVFIIYCLWRRKALTAPRTA